MIYYKHKTTGEVYAYATEDERQKFGPSDLVKMAQDQVDAHLNPHPTNGQLAENARSKRDALLRSTDWTQVPDAPVDQGAWAIYRQALRDITLQEGFPEKIEWPTEP